MSGVDTAVVDFTCDSFILLLLLLLLLLLGAAAFVLALDVLTLVLFVLGIIWFTVLLVSVAGSGTGSHSLLRKKVADRFMRD